MKNTLAFALLILVLASCKKEEFEPAQTQGFTIHSSSTGADYCITVGLPDNYDASKKYAAVYVLDGEDNFNYVAEKSKQFSEEFGTSNILVVSIGYGRDRAVDYTPTDADEGDGGAEQFMTFIKDELIPKMETDFGVDTSRSSRIILGHSFGGLFAAYAFTNHNNVFGNYLMLSPSIWYDNEVILRFEQQHRALNKDSEQLVYLGLGEMENGGQMLAPFMAFKQCLEKNYSNMKIESRFQPGLEHTGSKNPNIEDGLKFYFQNK